MVLKIAWRNIWRNKRRSLVVIVAIALGIWSIIFLTGFADGMYKTMIDNAIESQYSHIQIHNPKYKEDKEIKIPYLIMKDCLLFWIRCLRCKRIVPGLSIRE